jgi:peroxiredoxin
LLQVLEATAERDAMGPQVGDLPPDFTLKRLGGDDTVTLSSLREQRPVALVFGSYT